MMQYHFSPQKQGFRPYVGAGINYTHFFNEENSNATRLEFENSIGYALQVGFDYGVNEHWALNFEVKKMFIDSDVQFQSPSLRFNSDVNIDPWVFGMGVAYRF